MKITKNVWPIFNFLQRIKETYGKCIYTVNKDVISNQSKIKSPNIFPSHVCASLWINPYVALQGLTDLGVSSAEVLWLPEPRSSRRDRGVGGLDSHLIGRFSSLMAESSLLYIWNAQRSYKVCYCWLLCIDIFQWILIVKKAELPIKTCFIQQQRYIYMYIVTLIIIHP